MTEVKKEEAPLFIILFNNKVLMLRSKRIFRKLFLIHVFMQNMNYSYRKQWFWSAKINFDNIWV